MIYKTAGIIFKQIKYGESSFILDIFTEVNGLRSCIVSGARAKNSKAAMYQIMNSINMVAYDKGADKLNRIKESSLDLIYRDIPVNIFKSSIGIFMMDVCNHTIKEREPNPELFQFIKSWLVFLDDTKDTLAYLPCLFLLELSEYLGFKPQVNYSPVNPLFSLTEGEYVQPALRNQYILSEHQSRQLHALQTCKKEQGMNDLQFSKTDRKELLQQLINFFRYHVEGFKELKSLEVLAGVLS